MAETTVMSMNTTDLTERAAKAAQPRPLGGGVNEALGGLVLLAMLVLGGLAAVWLWTALGAFAWIVMPPAIVIAAVLGGSWFEQWRRG